MSSEDFGILISNNQPHTVFKTDWHTYYSIDFADTFLPKAHLIRAWGLWVYDGAELFSDSEKSPRKMYALEEENKFIALVTYTYPKGVLAQERKNNVRVEEHEVCTFIELDEDGSIEVFFKLGQNFIDFLRKSSSLNPYTVENTNYKTDVVKLKTLFDRHIVHYNMMEFVLKTIGVDETKTYQKEKEMEEETIYEQAKGTDILRINEEGTALMQVKHEFVNVGESIAQVKYNTSATVTTRGTIIVSQFKQEISSRGADVFYYKNSLGTFEGTLQDAANAFPDVDFTDIKLPPTIQSINPEFGNVSVSWNSSKPVEWQTINEYDAAQNNGKPTTWDKWKEDTDKALDAFQTALDVAGLVPGAGEVADCLNGVISLARGNYADAALSFAAMIPVIGGVATGIKQARKVKKVEGVYDLIVKNGNDIKGYVGQSNDTAKRIIDHFNPKRGKLKHTILEKPPIIHKMPGSLPREREIYEQFVILEKYQGQINLEKNPLAKLLNKVNPVGGRFDLKTPEGLKEFKKEALEVSKKYNLPTTFDSPTF